ncbi:juvenile hormone acid O-methyltransferase-like [Ixodes scapularis]
MEEGGTGAVATLSGHVSGVAGGPERGTAGASVYGTSDCKLKPTATSLLFQSSCVFLWENDFSGTEVMHCSPRCHVLNTTGPPYPAVTEESRPLPRLFPELYVKANALQRTVNIRALELLQSSFRDRPNADQQQFMDLGCGTGDFTLQELLPRCQPCRRIIATDVAKDMVWYARENYPHPQIEYEVYDIADDASGLVKSYGKFDRVYSFFVLQWVKDQVTAFGHISDLMTSGGECLLTIVARSTTFEIWKRIVRMDRWKSYAQICEFYTPVSHDIADHSGLISYMMKVLKAVNLVPYTCEVLRIEIRAEDMDETIEMSTAINPILPMLPEESRTEFKNDLANVLRTFWAEKDGGDPHYYHDVYVVHACKP